MKRRHVIQFSSTVSLLLFAGCATIMKPQGMPCMFEIPFMGDYDVVNHVSFNWDDAFVTNNPAEYHHELTGPLACLAASTYGSRLFMDVRSLMDLGVPPERLLRCYEEDGTLKYRHPKYGRDVAGFTIGSRMSEVPGNDFGIVFIAIRGTVGLEDWLSNLNMCNEWGAQTNLTLATLPKYHEGFYKSAQFILDALEHYVKEYKVDLTKAKILVTGHSRGAATANLVTKILDDVADDPQEKRFAGLKRDNIYCYSIATPNVTIRESPDTRDPKYNNIYSIVSSEDLVPLIPFSQWGSGRYGRTLVLKSWSTIFFGGSYFHPAYVGMKNNFKDIVGYEYWHMFLGTTLIDKVPEFAMKIAPTIGHYYYVKPEMRAEGNATSTHSFLEMVLWKNIPSSTDPLRHCSLMGDIQHLADAYEQLTDTKLDETAKKAHWDHKLRFMRPKNDDGPFNPDGRDFSRQPGLFDVVWKVTCMHAPATYISWMKSGVDHGPDSIYDNWDEVFPEE